MGAEAKRLTPIEDLKEVQIGSFSHKVTKICTSLYEEKGCEIVNQLIKNACLFAWAPSNMPAIDTKLVSHPLTIHPSAKPVAQRKHKVGKEKRAIIDEK